jgi:hypothetical protein
LPCSLRAFRCVDLHTSSKLHRCDIERANSSGPSLAEVALVVSS